jgi:hypothetical protein
MILTQHFSTRGNTMKKILIYSAILSTAILFGSTSVLAQEFATNSSSTPGYTVTLSSANDTPSTVDITFDPSPSVIIAVTSTENQYAITSMNASASDGERNEYGIWSGNTGYYQNVNAADTSKGLTNTDFGVKLGNDSTLDDTLFDTWTNMGGGGMGGGGS